MSETRPLIDVDKILSDTDINNLEKIVVQDIGCCRCPVSCYYEDDTTHEEEKCKGMVYCLLETLTLVIPAYKCYRGKCFNYSYLKKRNKRRKIIKEILEEFCRLLRDDKPKESDKVEENVKPKESGKVEESVDISQIEQDIKSRLKEARDSVIDKYRENLKEWCNKKSLNKKELTQIGKLITNFDISKLLKVALSMFNTITELKFHDKLKDQPDFLNRYVKLTPYVSGLGITIPDNIFNDISCIDHNLDQLKKIETDIQNNNNINGRAASNFDACRAHIITNLPLVINLVRKLSNPMYYRNNKLNYDAIYRDNILQLSYKAIIEDLISFITNYEPYVVETILQNSTLDHKIIKNRQLCNVISRVAIVLIIILTAVFALFVTLYTLRR